jgi:hypothetical protein
MEAGYQTLVNVQKYVCPPIYSTAIRTVTCTANGKQTINCTDAIDGTTAEFNCATFYENVDARPAVCTNGSWSKRIPDCQPVCGKISPTRQPTLIVGGRVSKQGQFPWQVALYRFQTFICGGSLLNERLILTGKFSTVLEMELQHSKIQDVPE